jgi:hypothetical protein
MQYNNKINYNSFKLPDVLVFVFCFSFFIRAHFVNDLWPAKFVHK